jgi:hypothetical protein
MQAKKAPFFKTAERDAAHGAPITDKTITLSATMDFTICFPAVA